MDQLLGRKIKERVVSNFILPICRFPKKSDPTCFKIVSEEIAKNHYND